MAAGGRLRWVRPAGRKNVAPRSWRGVWRAAVEQNTRDLEGQEPQLECNAAGNKLTGMLPAMPGVGTGEYIVGYAREAAWPVEKDLLPVSILEDNENRLAG